jgi:hypothetical protein
MSGNKVNPARFKVILENCQEYVNLLKTGEKGCLLIRGVLQDEFDFKLCKWDISQRTPRDMPVDYHNGLNTHFEKIFGWPVRNGLFTYGVKSNFRDLTDIGYGKSYLIFPCAQFKYVYDPNIYDLFEHYYEYCRNELDKANIQSFIETIHYFDTDIGKAMANSVHDFRSVEIMINCEQYYLINIKYVEEIIDLIWL